MDVLWKKEKSQRRERGLEDRSFPMTQASSADPSIDDVLGVIYDVALDPARYEELCASWEAVLWPQIRDGANSKLESRVVSHFTRAEDVLDLIESHPSGAGMPEIAGFLEGVGSAAALVIDRDLLVAAINSAGARLLSAEVGSKVSNLPILEDDVGSFLKHVQRMLKQSDAADSIIRVRRQKSEHLIVFHLRALRTQSGECCVAAITSDLHWPQSFQETLSNAFSLSRAESDIVRMIVDCKSVNDIAAQRGRSIGTVRNQIKSILAKTGSRSQIELVRLVMSVMEVATNNDEPHPGETRTMVASNGNLPPAKQCFVTGSDGRKLEYLILGDREGAPAYYLHTELGLSRLPVFIEENACRRGLRVISPIRAGFGQSDPVPKGCDFGTQVAQDLLTIMDQEGISVLPVISMAADNAFPARMHILRPGSVSAIIATSGCFPFINDEQAARQQRMHRLVHSTARYFPKLLPFVAKASFKAVRKMGKDRFVAKMFANSPADLAVFQHPEVREAVLEGSDVALSDIHSAHEAFILQCLSYHEPDQLTLLPSIENQLPFHSLNGLKDPSIHADTLAENQRRYPWIEFHIYPDAGQWLFFQHPDDVFDLVERYVMR